MTDAGFDEIGGVEGQGAGNTQGQFEGRKAAPAFLHIPGVHADRGADLTGRIGKAQYHGAKGELAGGVDVGVLDPPARRRNKPGGRGGLGPRFGFGAVPDAKARANGLPPRSGQRRAGQVPVFVEPCDDVAGRRIHDAVAKAQFIAVNREYGAFDMKAGAGAKLTRETSVHAARQCRTAPWTVEAEFIGEVRLRFFQTVEVIGDREVLGDIALPGRHRATVGLGPIGHDPVLYWLVENGSRGHPLNFGSAQSPGRRARSGERRGIRTQCRNACRTDFCGSPLPRPYNRWRDTTSASCHRPAHAERCLPDIDRSPPCVPWNGRD